VVGTCSKGTWGDGVEDIQEHLTWAWERTESDRMTKCPARKESEGETKEGSLAERVAPNSESKPLVLLQVNCRSINNKDLDLWNVIDTYCITLM
jgi:hypothetical protein